MSMLAIGGAAAAVGILLAGWGVWRIRRRVNDASNLVRTVELSQVPELAKECIQVFQEKLSLDLSALDPDGKVMALGNALSPGRRVDTMIAFDRPDHPGWFVLPMGALLGSLMVEAHASSAWRLAEGGGLMIHTQLNPDAHSTAHPFDKIMKQLSAADPADLLAYFQAFKSIDLSALTPVSPEVARRLTGG